ncbi:hypothetical protein TWF281_005338 [Arthrobotrys megalospora]
MREKVASGGAEKKQPRVRQKRDWTHLPPALTTRARKRSADASNVQPAPEPKRIRKVPSQSYSAVPAEAGVSPPAESCRTAESPRGVPKRRERQGGRLQATGFR